RPRAFMMFQTSGLNTGKVRLEAVIFGFCCAGEGVGATAASTQAAATIASARRENLTMASLLCVISADPSPRPFAPIVRAIGWRRSSALPRHFSACGCGVRPGTEIRNHLFGED